MPSLKLFSWMICLALLGGCSYEPPTKTEAGALREAFEALAAHDWDRYERASITTAALLEREEGAQRNLFLDKQSYAATLKREQRQAQREDFERASRGGPGWIDFGHGEFVGLGSVLASGTLSEMQSTYKIYSLRLLVDGKELDTRELYPRFVVVPWGDGYHRVLGLELPPAEP